MTRAGTSASLPSGLLPAILLALVAPTIAADRPSAHWPQWRGPLGTGVAPHGDPPVTWDADRNVRWKVEIPGRGHATPVVWHDRVFVTTAVPYGESLEPRFSGAPGAHDNLPVTRHHRFAVLAFSLFNGKELWRRTVHRERPHEGGHVSASLASASPVTDGTQVYAFFGSRGLHCLDFEGRVVWRKQLGRMRTKHGHGEGSSPALHGDTLIVNWDHEGASFVAALDRRDGAERWRVERDERTSWATPIVVDHDGVTQVIVSGTRFVRAYDLRDGRLIWKCAGLSDNVVATPVAGHGMIFAGSSYDHQALLAIRLDGARDDVTGTEHVVWSRSRRTPYVPSPLLHGGALYYLNHYQGVMSRVDAATGQEPHGPFRLQGLRDIYASPVAAAGRIYVTDRAGTTLVLSDDVVPKVLAANRLDDRFSASAAIAGDALILRGERHLFCLAAPR